MTWPKMGERSSPARTASYVLSGRARARAAETANMPLKEVSTAAEPSEHAAEAFLPSSAATGVSEWVRTKSLGGGGEGAGAAGGALLGTYHSPASMRQGFGTAFDRRTPYLGEMR